MFTDSYDVSELAQGLSIGMSAKVAQVSQWRDRFFFYRREKARISGHPLEPFFLDQPHTKWIKKIGSQMGSQA
jgi:hypothetical protein